MTNVCDNCMTDVDLYADICEELIPLIRTHFPNARIAMSGSRDLVQLPWNQVLIDRFGSGDNHIDAAVFHFYPEAIDPDMLDIEVCTGQAGSYDYDNVLHFQQKSIEDLFVQKRMDLFENSDIDIWITEFNNYDFSETCNEMYTSGIEDSEFTFDTGNWIHTLSIMNLFHEFIAMNSQVDDPWMNSSKNLEIKKLCMQVMCGSDRVAAIRDDRQLSAQGMAIETLMALTHDATSITRLLIGPSENFTFDGQGDWQAAPGLQGPLPYHFNLEYLNDENQLTTMATWDTYGFKFNTPQGPRVLVVNLKDQALTVNMSHVEGFSQGAHCLNRSVSSALLNQPLLHEHSSSQIHNEIADVSSSAVNIPAYSICLLNGIAFTPTGLEETYAISDKDINVFPNTSEGQITVSLDASFNAIQFSVLDVAGKVLKSQNSGQTSGTFDLNELQNGMYFMEVQAGEQRIMKPFVIQH